MTNAIGDLKDAGQAVKDGFEHVGDAIERELGGKPKHEAEPNTVTPDDCGPMHCEIEEEPAQA
ncbi:MAG TPA: hypothetical protein VHZ97_18875 [Pseudonocardiaceae bacterium]|jgi:hypothetical protein|nr:hypothetical protein [Pseudonocardiaceae bacterium]